MVRAADSGSPAPTSSFASLERTLERTVETLLKRAPSEETEALLSEARKLRAVLAGWHETPPPAEVYDEVLDRVLHLSTSSGASLYDPAPGLLRAEFDPVMGGDREPPLFDDDYEQTERTEFDPSSRMSHADTARTEVRDDDEVIPQGSYYPQARSALTALAQHVNAGGSVSASKTNSVIAAAAEAPRAPLDSSPRSAKPLTSAGLRPNTNANIAPRGRPLTTRSAMSAYAAPPRVTQSSDDPPEYPAFDSPAYGDDAPSYPAYDMSAHIRQQMTDGPRPRQDSAPQAQVTSTSTAIATPIPSAMSTSTSTPARSPASPPPMRSEGNDGIGRERLQSSAPVESGDAVEDAPVTPVTLVSVHAVTLGEKIDPNIVLLSDAYSDRADAYRALRRRLASAGNPQVIAVTSPNAGEGKTTCALNLALAIIETARGKVLLIEANSLSPVIAGRLGFAAPECFADQILRHREAPSEPWVAVEVLPKLHIMAMDAAIKRAPQLDPIAFSNGMEQLKHAGYEYIVLDTPPVLGTFEVNMIADTVDGVLFTAITMKSKRSKLKKAIEQIMPAPVLGVIVLDT